ncbi:YDG/SRA domain-containing protein [Nitrosopumilus sp.]|uniref:YDG/SRA domain-containing protein n=1 Tax=Nitrosopumilus sp. TaxID=2024843 RepID=UPI00247C92B4|nr:YDG/SRA domain-containing protein [Nitrosopumilus sp.]MCV0431479.1 HNH endonuclease [Nitrosopumilus sp.]
MSTDIISYGEMTNRENGLHLQHGMNFEAGGQYSIILMSQAPNAPYNDELKDNGLTLIYEGHDVPRYSHIKDPKALDQPETTPNGTLAPNGKFHRAAQSFKKGNRDAEKVRVYEKIKSGIWAYNGVFNLTDSWIESDGKRKVFKFRLEATSDTIESKKQTKLDARRIIPTKVKQEVWKRDEGKCVQCDATTDLHFDHIIPHSKGGTSITAENIQILCAKHNLEKRDRIE